jgi:hypothetical protein
VSVIEECLVRAVNVDKWRPVFEHTLTIIRCQAGGRSYDGEVHARSVAGNAMAFPEDFGLERRAAQDVRVQQEIERIPAEGQAITAGADCLQPVGQPVVRGALLCEVEREFRRIDNSNVASGQ